MELLRAQTVLDMNNIYPVFVPDSAKLPCAVIYHVSDVESSNVEMNRSSRLVTERISVCIFDTKLMNIQAKVDSFNSCIDCKSGTIASEDVDSIIYAQSSSSGYDEDIESYFVIRDFYVKYRS